MFPQKRSRAAAADGRHAELNGEAVRRAIVENHRRSDPAHEIDNEKNDQYRPKNTAADVHGNLRW
jgi:hypothetical protein